MLAVGRSCWVGVDFFFVLSGFLITGILLRSRGQPHYFSSFFARRVLRIFPLYYAVIFLALVVLPQIPAVERELDTTISEGHGWWYWLYFQNILMAIKADFSHIVLAVTWSLAVEEQFYLLWPIVVWYCPARRLAWVCYGVIFGALILRGFMTWRGSHAIATYVLTPARADTLAVGSLIAALTHLRVDPLRLCRIARWAGAASASLLLLWIVYRGRLNWTDDAVRTLGYSVVAALAGALVVLLLHPVRYPRLAAWFSIAPLVSLGTYSYALYLFHVPISAVIRKLWGRIDPSSASTQYEMGQGLATAPPWFGERFASFVLMLMACYLVTFVFAWLSWHLYEKHFLHLKRFFPRVAVSEKSASGTGGPSGIPRT